VEKPGIGSDAPVVIGSQTIERFDPRPHPTRWAYPGKTLGSRRDSGYPALRIQASFSDNDYPIQASYRLLENIPTGMCIVESRLAECSR
jgi:hypothetical protein